MGSGLVAYGFWHPDSPYKVQVAWSGEVRCVAIVDAMGSHSVLGTVQSS